MHRSRLRKDHNPRPEHDQPVTKPDKKKVVRRTCRFSHEELVGAYVTKQDDGSYHTQNLQRKTNKTKHGKQP